MVSDDVLDLLDVHSAAELFSSLEDEELQMFLKVTFDPSPGVTIIQHFVFHQFVVQSEKKREKVLKCE